MKILDVNSPTFATDLAKEIGPGPHEIATPQFYRTDGVLVNAPDMSEAEWRSLCSLPPDRLRQLGCQVWSDDAKGTHWLFPAQWYPYIPEGLPVTDINGKTKLFARGLTDDDIRFGALSFGFINAKEPT